MSPYFALYIFTGATFWECLPSLQCSENRRRDEVDVTVLAPEEHGQNRDIDTENYNCLHRGGCAVMGVCTRHTGMCTEEGWLLLLAGWKLG